MLDRPVQLHLGIPTSYGSPMELKFVFELHIVLLQRRVGPEVRVF